MFSKIQEQLQKEQVQRALLHTAGTVVTILASQAFAAVLNKGINTGIDALMERLHPTVNPTE